MFQSTDTSVSPKMKKKMLKQQEKQNTENIQLPATLSYIATFSQQVLFMLYIILQGIARN
jgi:hypothetical protein